MKFICFFTCLFIGSNSLFAGTLKLSNDAEVRVLTCAPGDELYSLFGHSAIRISDSINNLDLVYNFGTFDFQSQHFYFKFARGTLPYKLSKSSFDGFMNEYYYYERSVYAQRLNLNHTQIQMMYDLLENNCLPENRYYYYNFLYDNCSTRIRDLIETCFDRNELVWKTNDNVTKSFWNLLDEYLKRSLWIQWGIHTILGSPATSNATVYEQMFLPDYLMNGLDSACYLQQRIAEPIELLYDATKQRSSASWYLSPLFVFFILNVFVIFVLSKTESIRWLKLVIIIFFAITGIVGCLLLFLAFFTIHPTTFPNFNMIWANPLNLVAIYFFVRRNNQYLYWYALCYFLLLLLGLFLWPFLRPAVLYSTMLIITMMIYLMIRLLKLLKYDIKHEK